MKRTHLWFTVAALVAMLGVKSYAWDSYGHMLVAYAAYQNLTPATKARVNSLIKRNPKQHEWAGWIPAGTSTADKNMILFMLTATWPDEIKGDPSYTSDGSDHGNRPSGSPDPSANKGYSDKLMHKYWHFIDTPFTDDGTTLPQIPTPNASERIGLFRSVLASSQKDKLKSYDLVWLLHLVGDVHQPLHCATRVSSNEQDGDSGGNNVKLNGSPSELHAFWDDVVGEGQAKDIIQSVLNSGATLPPADPSLVGKLDVADWIAESFQAAKDTVYASPIAAGDGPFTITPAYTDLAKQTAQARIALAGARLAQVLNQELK